MAHHYAAALAYSPSEIRDHWQRADVCEAGLLAPFESGEGLAIFIFCGDRLHDINFEIAFG